jgi:hypothetical protein
MADQDRDDRRMKAPLFNGKDYWTWSFRFTQWATCEELWPYYEGTVTARPAAEGAAQTRWDKRNMRAFAELCNALEPDELIRLVREFGASTTLTPATQQGQQPVRRSVPPRPHEAWERLSSFYVQRQLSSQMIVERELNSLQMREGETIGAYWARGDELRQRYHAAGGQPSALSWRGRIIAGLPPSWETLKVVLNSQFASMTEEQLLGALTAEEARQKEQSTAAAYSVRGQRTGRSSGDRDADRDAGEDSRHRPKVLGKDGSWGQMGWAPMGHCHGCHKKGHRWERCKKRPDGAVPDCVRQARGRGDAAAAAGDRDDGELALVTAVVGEAPATATQERAGWWVDSGASHNFTPSAADIKGGLQPAEVSRVKLPDGTLVPTQGMGMVTLSGEGGKLVTLTKVHVVPQLGTRLLSVSHMTARGFRVEFEGAGCALSRSGTVLFRAAKDGGRDHGLYRLAAETVVPREAPQMTGIAAVVTAVPEPQRVGSAEGELAQEIRPAQERAQERGPGVVPRVARIRGWRLGRRGRQGGWHRRACLPAPQPPGQVPAASAAARAGRPVEGPAAVWAAAVGAALLASAARQETSGAGAPSAQHTQAEPQRSSPEVAAPKTRPVVRDSICIAQLAQILFSDRFRSVIQLVPHASRAVSSDPSVPHAGSVPMAVWPS